MIDHVLIVGLGSIGRRHLQAVKKLKPDCLITVVSRTQKHISNELADFCARSIKEALFENPIEYKISCALICTPSSEHLENSIELCEKGIHLLIEKPISDDPIKFLKFDKLIKTSRTKNLKVLVGYVLRHHPAAKKFKQLIDNNKIGEIFHVSSKCCSYLPDWRPEQDYRLSVSAKKNLGGGVLLELSHEIDYLRWFFGEMESVYAELYNSNMLEIDVEDSANLILKTKGGTPIMLHLDFLNRQPKRKITALGSQGEAELDLIRQTVSLKRGLETVEFAYNKHYNYNYEEQLAHFFRCIEHDEDPIVSAEDAIQTLKVVELSRQSNKNKSKMFFK